VVNTGQTGTYVITYNVSDSAGNAAAEVTRTVIIEVEPSTPPRKSGGGGSLGLLELLVALGALVSGSAARRRP
jgi:hypothetical protein